MNQRDSTKITLSKLRGKASNQSVPSISFRFDPSSNDLTEVHDTEDSEEHTVSDNSFGDSLLEENEEEKDHSQDAQSKQGSKLINQRSSSLDSSSCPTQESTFVKVPDSSSLISRLTKNIENKISEIRNEKQREKELKIKENREIPESIIVNHEKDETQEPEFPIKYPEEKENTSPVKAKTSIVQDITEQTNKIKSELQKSIIKPRLSELRNRKNSRDNLSLSKPKGSLLTSLLGRDEGIVTEELFKNCNDIDPAEEAEEFVNINAQTINISFHKSSENLTPDKELDPSIAILDKIENTIPNNAAVRGYLIQILVKYLSSLKTEYFKYLLLVIAVCPFLPLPGFLAGILFGIGVASLIFIFVLKCILPSNEEEVEEDFSSILMDVPQYNDYPLYKGWMNKLEGEYFPEKYHVSLTHSVYLRLQGSILQIDHPRRRIGKHAKPKEDLNSGGFIHNRKYNLSGCQVLLLPRNLPRKWLWSRKYPLCLHLRPRSAKSSTSTASTPSKSKIPSPLLENLDTFGPDTTDASHDPKADGLLLPFDLSSYEEITEEMCSEKSLYFFARSDREKDDWFRRFVSAAEFGVSKDSPPLQTVPTDIPSQTSDLGSEEATASVSEDAEKNVELPKPKKLSFEHYMARILHKDIDVPLNINWFNCLVGRILFDFLHNQFWAHKIQERIQRKLSKLHIPYFIEDILVCGVDLGSSIPQFSSVDPPTSDSRGLWVDFQASYTGSFTLSLETKVNLMKLKEKAAGGAQSNPPSPAETPPHSTPQSTSSKVRAYSRSPSSDCILYNVQFDTDTDDSVESSSEEEYDETAEGFSGSGGPTSRKLLRIVDTVTASRYFQHASEWKVLQRAMQGVSNTRIELSVEVKHLAGTLTVNIPPPPSDRIWYGFRGSPDLRMVARPCLGDRPLNLPFLAEFIQKQLKLVFEKVFVLPNMDDLVIPVMSPLLPGQSPPPRPWETQSGPSSKTSPINSKGLNLQSQSFHPVARSLDNAFEN